MCATYKKKIIIIYSQYPSILKELLAKEVKQKLL